MSKNIATVFTPPTELGTEYKHGYRYDYIDTWKVVVRLLGDKPYFEVAVRQEIWSSRTFLMVSIFDNTKCEVVVDIREELDKFPSTEFFNKLALLR